MWEPTLAELQTHELWSADYKLSTIGPKGILFVACPNDVWDLFSLEASPGDTSSIVANEENLKAWNVTVTKYQEIIAAVSA